MRKGRRMRKGRSGGREEGGNGGREWREERRHPRRHPWGTLELEGTNHTS